MGVVCVGGEGGSSGGMVVGWGVPPPPQSVSSTHFLKAPTLVLMLMVEWCC